LAIVPKEILKPMNHEICQKQGETSAGGERKATESVAGRKHVPFGQQKIGREAQPTNQTKGRKAYRIKVS
jgi:hypothetical protein